MPNLSIKNVPDEVVEKLHARAAANRRSLQGELMCLVCDAAAGGEIQYAQREPVEQETGWLSVEEIAARNRARRPKPIMQGPFAVDIIREDRDSR